MPDEVVYPKFQSTLLQEERHVDRTWSDHFFCISIHAPTRGATILQCDKCVIVRISIHAPTRGATKSSLKWMISVYDFNPRSYKRSDVTRSPILIPFSDFQSTLLQEERPMHLLLHPQIQSFNPRSYKRSDNF